MLLKKGSRGPDVKDLQEALGLAADGSSMYNKQQNKNK